MDFTSLNPYVVVAVLAVICGGTIWLIAWGKNDRNVARKDEHPLNRDLVDRATFDQLDRKVSDLDAKVDQKFSEAGHASSNSRKEIYNRLVAIEKQNAAQQATQDLVLAELSKLDRKIDNLRDRK